MLPFFICLLRLALQRYILFGFITVFDVLSFNKELIRRLDLLGLKLGDYKYINLYSEYEDMYKAGEKMTYIVSFLSVKYGISERKVYMIVKLFKSDCKMLAV